MPDIDFELVSVTAPQADDVMLVRRGSGSPNTAAVVAVPVPETFMQARWIWSDFMTASNNAEQPYVWTALSAGTAANFPTVYDPKHPGSIIIRDSTTANGGGHWSLGGGLRGSAGLAARIIASPKLFTGVTTRLGFHDSTTSSVTDGAYFDIDPTTGIVSAICRNNSAETVSGTTLQLVLGNWYTFDIDYLTDSSVRFTISDDTGARLMQTTISSNVPNTDARGFNFRTLTREGTISAAVDILWLDYMGCGPARPLNVPVP